MWFNHPLNKRKLGVIILDDNEQIKASFRQSIDGLISRAYVVDCTSPDELWSALKTTPFDLLIIDSKLDGANSLDIIRDAKYKYGQLKVLGLTSNANDPFIEFLVQAGVDGCMSKFDVQKKSVKIAFKKMKL